MTCERSMISYHHIYCRLDQASALLSSGLLDAKLFLNIFLSEKSSLASLSSELKRALA